ncbi:MAG: hypothetical protein F6K16_29040 [Symploca sp. SIO2B6]|nr:hypothetical protein [Symploca sp. SIO2B6]
MKSQSKSQVKPRQAPSVPISVYRDLAQELEATKQQLSTLGSENQMLRQQNQSLRQEVSQVISSAASLQRMVQAMDQQRVTPGPHVQEQGIRTAAHPPNTIDSHALDSDTKESTSLLDSEDFTPSNGVADELIAELDRTLAAQIGAPTVSPSSPERATSEAIASGPFCDVAPGPMTEAAPEQISQDDVTKFFTEQPVEAPDAIALAQDERKSKPISGVWLALTLLVVIVSAFSAGFLVMLPFIQTDQTESE